MEFALEAGRLAVLERFGLAGRRSRWVDLGSAGGFSGARIWRGSGGPEPDLALKAWPPGFAAERLRTVHARMCEAARLPFVPTVLSTREGQAVVAAAGRVWDVTAWVPGVPRTEPSAVFVASACAALAELHRVWRSASVSADTVPAVRNRLNLLTHWKEANGPQRPPDVRHRLELAVSVGRGWRVAVVAAEWAMAALRPWGGRAVRVQPCLCDVWAAHVLFTGSVVTGIVDYGAVKLDHPACDLARLLGDWVGDDAALFATGLAAYRDAGGECDTPGEFVRLLDQTGTVCAVVNWLLRLGDPAYSCPDPQAVAARLDRLTNRVERFLTRPGTMMS